MFTKLLTTLATLCILFTSPVEALKFNVTKIGIIKVLVSDMSEKDIQGLKLVKPGMKIPIPAGSNVREGLRLRVISIEWLSETSIILSVIGTD